MKQNSGLKTTARFHSQVFSEDPGGSPFQFALCGRQGPLHLVNCRFRLLDDRPSYRLSGFGPGRTSGSRCLNTHVRSNVRPRYVGRCKAANSQVFQLPAYLAIMQYFLLLKSASSRCRGQACKSKGFGEKTRIHSEIKHCPLSRPEEA